MKANICVASQDLDTIAPLITTLQELGHQAVSCDVPGTLTARCEDAQFDVVFIDALIHNYNEIITDLHNACPGTEVVIITSYASATEG